MAPSKKLDFCRPTRRPLRLGTLRPEATRLLRGQPAARAVFSGDAVERLIPRPNHPLGDIVELSLKSEEWITTY